VAIVIKVSAPIMARIASLLSTRLILTSDNPRNDDPHEILEDMRKGMTLTKEKNDNGNF